MNGEIWGLPGPSRANKRKIPMHSIKYQVVGEEDYAFEVKISSTGEYEVNSGTYTTEPPRKGTLTEEQEVDLLAAIKALGIPNEHPVPQGGNAFEAHLTIGEEDEAVTYSFWEGALEDDPRLNDLVRRLEML
jgi:hypothetical protein